MRPVRILGTQLVAKADLDERLAEITPFPQSVRQVAVRDGFPRLQFYRLVEVIDRLIQLSPLPQSDSEVVEELDVSRILFYALLVPSDGTVEVSVTSVEFAERAIGVRIFLVERNGF